MSKEIERKFLVVGDEWRDLATGTQYRQGYLNSIKERTVRIRTIADKAFLTVKGPTVGVTRLEYEYEIPYADCVEMLEHLAEQPIIEKNRYKIAIGKHVWEIDEFLGVNNIDQMLMERHLARKARMGKGKHHLKGPKKRTREEDEAFEKPEWIGEEVSGDPRYFNSNLVAHPFTTWEK